MPKKLFLNIWPGKKSLSSNKACDVKSGTEVILSHKSLLFSFEKGCAKFFVSLCFGAMSTSGSDSDDSSTSENSDVSQIYDYEQEIEEEDSPSDNTRGENSAVVPYDEEPIADEAWVQNYKKKTRA